MSNIKISELESATELNPNDLLMIIQGNKNKKISADKVGNGIKELIGTSTDPINANNVTTAGVYKVSGDKTNFYVNDGTFILFVQMLENRGNVTLIQHMLTQNGLAIRTGTYEIIEQEIYWNFTNWELQSGAGGGDTLPIGTILAFSGDTAPEDFLFCRGQAVSRTTYSELFEVIGTQYGSGDGSTTFNLPDYSGKVAVGLDSNDTDFDTLGETGGEKTHTLTIDEMPSHTHEIKKAGTAGGDGSGLAYSSTATTNSAGVLNTGNSQAHNNLQPYIVQNFIIKFKKTTITDGEVIQENDTATTENVYSASAVDNILSTIKEGDWQNVTMASNWRQYSDAFNSLQCKKTGKRVDLRGIVGKSSGSFTGDELIATLPEGYRPQKRLLVACLNAPTTIQRIDFGAGGTIKLPSVVGSGNYISFESISFYID